MTWISSQKNPTFKAQSTSTLFSLINRLLRGRPLTPGWPENFLARKISGFPFEFSMIHPCFPHPSRSARFTGLTPSCITSMQQFFPHQVQLNSPVRFPGFNYLQYLVSYIHQNIINKLWEIIDIFFSQMRDNVKNTINLNNHNKEWKL